MISERIEVTGPTTGTSTSGPLSELPNGSSLHISGLQKTYRRVKSSDGARTRALETTSLQVAPGEFLVLLGPSGCGKTTLLRSIAGLEKPDAGRIEINGAVVFDAASRINIAPERRPVSMIFQSYALWPHLTAAQNVAFPLRSRRERRKVVAERVAEALERVAIGHLGRRYPAEMSGGEQQRLALARALVADEKVVLFDEPLSNVDAQVRDQLRLELIDLQRRLGFTAVYVTHDQNEAMALADRIAVMDRGDIIQEGPPRTLFESPRDSRVARFIGQSKEVVIQVLEYRAADNLVVGAASIGTIAARWIPDQHHREPPEVGENLACFLRPGDIDVSAVDSGTAVASDDVANCWRGRVAALHFFGEYWECLVEIANDVLRCWIPASKMTDDVGEGSPVRLTVSPHRVLVMRVGEV